MGQGRLQNALHSRSLLLYLKSLVGMNVFQRFRTLYTKMLMAVTSSDVRLQWVFFPVFICIFHNFWFACSCFHLKHTVWCTSRQHPGGLGLCPKVCWWGEGGGAPCGAPRMRQGRSDPELDPTDWFSALSFLGCPEFSRVPSEWSRTQEARGHRTL